MSVREYLFIEHELPSPLVKINVMRTESSFSMGPHCHDFYHVNRILEGALTVTLQGHDYPLTAGCIFVLPPQVPHTLTSPTGYTQLGVDLKAGEDPLGLIRELEKLSTPFPMTRIPLSAHQAGEILSHMHTLLTTPTIIHRMRAVNLAQKQVLDLLEGIGGHQQEPFPQRFEEMLSAHDPWELKLKDMCRILSMSRTQLEHHAHQTFGCGAVEYCQRLRYARICELLHGNATLESVAVETGFYDSCHLSKFFSARAHQTPGQYRKSLGL